MAFFSFPVNYLAPITCNTTFAASISESTCFYGVFNPFPGHAVRIRCGGRQFPGDGRRGRPTLVDSGKVRQRSLFLRADADLLLQCPQFTKAWGGHMANAYSRLATRSHDSMPALLRLLAGRDEPVPAR